MPTASVAIEIDAPREGIFDLIHDYARRLQWDPFLREATLLNAAPVADLGVSSRCVARRRAGGFAMETVYVSFNRPNVAAVKMTRGPFFLESFAATLRHDTTEAGRTRVTYRYNFTTRPCRLALILDPIIQWAFRRETKGRLAALKRFLETGRRP
jgi:polyketide cyclase/dehydrase/lipid transport protein